MSLSPCICVVLSYLVSSLSPSAPISVSDRFLGTLPWGSRSPVCRKPDLHHLFFIFWKVSLTSYLREVGGGRASCLTPPLSLPPPLLNPSPPPASCPREASPALSHFGISQALIPCLLPTAHCRAGKTGRPLLIN